MKRIFLSTIILLSAISISGYAKNTIDTITLKVGDKAPALKIGTWIKGSPVKHFQPGNVYLIEFSAVRCTPCRNSIPHLTDLARQFDRRISIISVYEYFLNVDETKAVDPNEINRVKDLVHTMGDRIGFSVAMDVPQQTTGKIWMKAAGIEGLPHVFIVDKAGVIAWIGSPFDLDSMLLDNILDNRFDEVQNAKIGHMRDKELSEYITTIFKYVRNANFDIATNLMDSLITANPNRTNLYTTKFNVIASYDSAKAYSWLQWMLDQNLNNYDWWHFIGDILRSKQPNYDMALKVADLAFDQAKTETRTFAAYVLDAKADIYYRKGDLQKAAELEEDAVKYAFGDPTSSPRDMKFLTARLAMYKEKIQQGMILKNLNE